MSVEEVLFIGYVCLFLLEVCVLIINLRILLIQECFEGSEKSCNVLVVIKVHDASYLSQLFSFFIPTKSDLEKEIF